MKREHTQMLHRPEMHFLAEKSSPLETLKTIGGAMLIMLFVSALYGLLALIA